MDEDEAEGFDQKSFKDDMAEVLARHGRDFAVFAYNDGDNIVISAWARTPLQFGIAAQLSDIVDKAIRESAPE